MSELIKKLLRDNNIETLEFDSPCHTALGEVTNLGAIYCKVEGMDEVFYDEFDNYDLENLSHEAEMQLQANEKIYEKCRDYNY